LTFKIVKRNSLDNSNIRNPTNWKHFGEGLDTDINNCVTNVGDAVFMEWNPEILKSRKSQSYIEKKLSTIGLEKTKVEIPLNSVDKNCFENLIKNIKYNTSSTSSKNSSSSTNTIDKIKIVNKSLVPNFLPDYIPPHLRNNKNLQEDKSYSDTKEYSNKRISVKISNIMMDYTTDELTEWLTYYTLPKYKLYHPINKKTGVPSDYAFLNLSSRFDIPKVIDILNGQRMDVCIIHVDKCDF
jgi:hypothetical protein